MTAQIKRLERMRQLLHMPRDAETLAAVLDVCVKTVRKDIAACHRLGVEIHTHTLRSGRRVYTVPKAKKQQPKRHNSLSEFHRPPGALKARYLTICLRDEQWDRIEWLAQHLNCEVERAATILLTQAAMEIDIEEMERHHGEVQIEEVKSRYGKY